MVNPGNHNSWCLAGPMRRSLGSMSDTNAVREPFSIFSGKPAILILFLLERPSGSFALAFKSLFCAHSSPYHFSSSTWRPLNSPCRSSRLIMRELLEAAACLTRATVVSKLSDLAFIEYSIPLMASRMGDREASSEC